MNKKTKTNGKNKNKKKDEHQKKCYIKKKNPNERY